MQIEMLQSTTTQDLHHRLAAMSAPERKGAKSIPVHISGTMSREVNRLNRERQWPHEILLGALLTEGYKALNEDEIISRWRRIRVCAAAAAEDTETATGAVISQQLDYRIQLLFARAGTIRRQAVIEPAVSDALAPLAEELLIERSDLSRLLIAIGLCRVSEQNSGLAEAVEDFYRWIRAYAFMIGVMVEASGLATDEQLVADVQAARQPPKLGEQLRSF